MNQKIKELLESATREHNDDCMLCAIKDTRINSVLAILRKAPEQPPASEFTKEIRNFIKLYENEVPRRAEITFLKEACTHLDASKAKVKDLLEALEKYGGHTKGKEQCASRFISDAKSNSFYKCDCGFEAAIAKAGSILES